MDINVLKCFISVVRHQSFTKAAIECHIAQPAVSQQMKKLENSLGCILMYRDKNNFHLTAAGESFYYDTLKVIELYNQAVQRCKHIAERNSKLIIGVNGWYDTQIFYALVQSFTKQYRNVHIDCIQANHENVCIGLTKYEYDATFIVTKMGLKPSPLGETFR